MIKKKKKFQKKKKHREAGMKQRWEMLGNQKEQEEKCSTEKRPANQNPATCVPHQVHQIKFAFSPAPSQLPLLPGSGHRASAAFRTCFVSSLLPLFSKQRDIISTQAFPKHTVRCDGNPGIFHHYWALLFWYSLITHNYSLSCALSMASAATQVFNTQQAGGPSTLSCISHLVLYSI